MNNDVRPPTITQLASIALDNLWDDSKPLKQWVRMAERLKKEAQISYNDGDFQTAFVQFARAATLVMEHLPGHPDFTKSLTAEQRHNLNMNGIQMMERMGEIKPILLQRVTDWDNAHQSRTSKPEVRFGGAQILPGAEEHRRTVNAKLNLGEKPETEPRKTAASLAAQKASAGGDEERMVRQRQKEDEAREKRMRQPEDERTRYLRQQEEMRRREEEIRRKKELNKKEKEEFARRQQEADEAARIVRKTISSNNPGVTVAPSTYVQPPASFMEPYRLPLESPVPMYDGNKTDSESRHRMGPIEYPTRFPARGGSITYPSPVTTASLPTAQARLQYPRLMTQHQQRQGYQPGFDNGLRPSPSPGPNPPYSYKLPQPQPQPHPQSYPVPGLSQTTYQPQPQSLGPTRPAPPIPQLPPPPPPPPPQNQPSTQPPPQQKTSSPRLSKAGLRQVNLPRECFSRFTNIATANTKKNLETCGLLLGRDRGNTYVVTTLLVPKQHATSDTCAMDQEELVMQFTEERGLITLGWIHTHPSQSCFMSSVDLHTHAGFQCMLRESFAVVCAPNSNPNFGIFRLTDPPGLETVLKCEAKEAFHPHPDLPIYTDADKSHVKMMDFPLVEIVDLR